MAQNIAIWIINLQERRAGADGVLLEVCARPDVDRVVLEQAIDAYHLLDGLPIHVLGQDDRVDELGLIELEAEDESMIRVGQLILCHPEATLLVQLLSLLFSPIFTPFKCGNQGPITATTGSVFEVL